MNKLLIVGILVWGLAVFNGLVGDDLGYINHPYIQKLQIAKLFVGSSSDLGGSSPITGQFYRPLMLLMLSFLYQIFGTHAWGYHLVQVSLAIVNSCLVYFLFRKYFKKSLSLILAIIFLVHPINSEVVLYISNFQDVLMMLFGLVGLLGWWPFLLLSLLAKETGVVFLILFWILRKNWKIPLGAGIIYLVIRWMAGLGMGTGLGQMGWPSGDVAWYYIKTFFWPLKLAIGQVWVAEPSVIKTIIFVIATTFIAVILGWRKKYWLFGGWTILGLLPHLQIIPLEMTVADRWFYFSSIGLIGIMGRVGKNLKPWIWAMIIILLGTRSVVRVWDWKDNLTLLKHDSQITNSYLLEQSLGYYLMENNQMDKAQVALEKAIKLKENTVNTNTLGVLYFRENNLNEAIKWFGKSIALGDNFQSYNNLARILISQEKWSEAEKVILEGQQKFPQSDNFWFLEAIVRYKQEQTALALEAIQKALEISRSPQNLYIYQQLKNNRPIQIN